MTLAGLTDFVRELTDADLILNAYSLDDEMEWRFPLSFAFGVCEGQDLESESKRELARDSVRPRAQQRSALGSHRERVRRARTPVSPVGSVQAVVRQPQRIPLYVRLWRQAMDDIARSVHRRLH